VHRGLLSTVAAALTALSVASPASAGATDAAPTTSLSRLPAALTRYLEQRAGSVTVGVLDLRTGARMLYRPRHPQRTASVVKVEILEALLARHHAPLRSARAAAARRMIEASSNPDAESLWRADGNAPGLARFGRRVGLRATRPAAARGPGYAWGLTLTTPADQLQLLSLLAQRNRVLNDKDRRFAARLMRSVAAGQRWGITAGVPRRALVAVKDGWLALHDGARDWQVNSVGYVLAPHHRYAVAVLTTGSPTMRYGIATIQHVSRLVWRHTGH
jgi:beta-lactamase class A